MKLSAPRVLLEAITPHRLFSRLTIASKMLMGYVVLAVLSVIVVVYALVSLQRLNSLNNGVIKVDVPVQEAADAMLDAVLAQDAYENSYLILPRADMRSLFWKRGEEFDERLAFLKTLPDRERLPLRKLEKLHRQYGDLFMKEVRLVRGGGLRAAQALSGRDLRQTSEQLIDAVKAMAAGAKRAQGARMKKISLLGGAAFRTTAALCILSIVIGALAGLVVTHHIASSIGKLEAATARIAEGDFHVDPRIDADDEIGGLAEAFRHMGRRLAKLEEMYLDASPLTRLPGGIAIENALTQRLESGRPLAFCVIDLDNFKAFNDRYGYAHGNDVIKEAARIIEGAVKTRGAPDDFVGHVGGDDFVVVTTPEVMRPVCEEIISRFDERVPQFYDARDRENGFIFGKTRQGEEMRFPLMTVSIAVVTNEHRRLTNPLEASEIAAELKDHAKTIARSVYVVDKRRAV